MEKSLPQSWRLCGAWDNKEIQLQEIPTQITQTEAVITALGPDVHNKIMTDVLIDK